MLEKRFVRKFGKRQPPAMRSAGKRKRPFCMSEREGADSWSKRPTIRSHRRALPAEDRWSRSPLGSSWLVSGRMHLQKTGRTARPETGSTGTMLVRRSDIGSCHLWAAGQSSFEDADAYDALVEGLPALKISQRVVEYDHSPDEGAPGSLLSLGGHWYSCTGSPARRRSTGDCGSPTHTERHVGLADS
jgi:hypothetical protein